MLDDSDDDDFDDDDDLDDQDITHLEHSSEDLIRARQHCDEWLN